VQRSLGPTRARDPRNGRRTCGGTGVSVGTGGSPVLDSKATLQQRCRRPIQHFFWPQLFKFFLNTTSGRLAPELRRAKLAGRKIQRRKTPATPDRCHGRKKIILF